MEAIGLGGRENAGRRLTVLRAIDKLDRLGIEGVRQLLGDGPQRRERRFHKGRRLGLDAASRSILVISTGQSPRELGTRRYHADVELHALVSDRVRRRSIESPASCTSYEATSRDLRVKRSRLAAWLSSAGYTMAAYGSIPPSSAASNITPARSSKRSSPSRCPTRRASRSSSARSAGEGAMTASSAASWTRTCRRPASPSACRASPRRSTPSASSATRGLTRPGGGHRHGYGPPRRLPGDCRRPPQRRHCGRDLSRLVRHEGAAEIRRPPQRACRHHRRARTSSSAGKLQIKDLAAGKAQAAADRRPPAAWRDERPGQFEVSRDEVVAKVKELLSKQRPS